MIEDYRMVLLVRTDLEIPDEEAVGKMGVQMSHATLSSFLQFLKTNPKEAMAYHEGAQPKVSLGCPDLATMLKIKEKAEYRKIPVALITDAGRTVFNEPTVTCLGLGPLSKTNSNSLTRGLKLLKWPAKTEGKNK